jgi:hypothetical protein
MKFVQAQILPAPGFTAAGRALIMSFNLGHKVGEANILGASSAVKPQCSGHWPIATPPSPC